MSKRLIYFLIIVASGVCQPLFAQTEPDPATSAADKSYDQAENFLRARNADSAVFYYKEAAALYLSQGEFQNALLTELRYSKLLSRMGRNIEIINRLERLWQKADSLNVEMTPNLATVLEKLASAYGKSGRHYKAHEYFLRFLKLSKAKIAEDSLYLEFIGKTYNNIAVDLMRSGRFEKAEIYFDSAMYELQKQNLEYSELAHVIYLNKGNVNKNLGYFGEAELYYLRSIDMLDIPSISPAEKGLAWWYLASFYLFRNQSDHDIGLARQYNDSAYQYLKDIPSLEIYCKYQYATIYQKSGDHDRALKILDQAENYLLKAYGPEYYELADVYTMKATNHQLAGNINSAIASVREALDFYENFYPENTEQRALALIELGKCYAIQEKPHKALALYQQSISTLQPDFRPAGLLENPSSDSLLKSATLFEALKQKTIQYGHLYNLTDSSRYFDAQLACFELMIEEIDLGRQDMVELESKMDFNEKRYNVYEQAIRACYHAFEKTGNSTFLEKAFSYSHSAKANELRDKISYANHRNTAEERHNPLLLEISDLKLVIGKLEKDIALNKDESLTKDLRTDLFENRTRLRALSDSLDHRTTGWLSSEKPGVRPEDFSGQLADANALMIEYLQMDDLLIVFCIGREFNAYSLPFGRDRIDLIEKYKRSIENKAFDPETGQQLYDFLLAPFLNYGSYTALQIIPDGLLSTFPFESLVTDKTDEGKWRFLIEDYRIAYNYSSWLTRSRFEKNRDYTYGFTGFSPDYTESSTGSLALRGVLEAEELYSLPYAKTEVANISKIFNGNHLDGKEASETNFKELAGRSRYLHIAGHAIPDQEQPMLSKVLFAEDPGTKEDGIAYAYEIYNMDLSAEMVVLSACNTGTGLYRKGEGLISLANSFMYAGSNNLVTSLWSVPDQPTSVIMTSFYTFLERGESKADALRMAKLEYLKNADSNTADPYFWAGFILIGDLQTDQDVSWQWLILPVIGIVIILLVLIRLRK